MSPSGDSMVSALQDKKLIVILSISLLFIKLKKKKLRIALIIRNLVNSKLRRTKLISGPKLIHIGLYILIKKDEPILRIEIRLVSKKIN
jgi:hypothetical protein